MNKQIDSDSADSGSGDAQGKRILVVEDDRDSREALCLILESMDYKISAAAGGAEALDLLNSKNQFDLALIDIMMPEMNGYQLLEKIREMPRYESMPVIMVTAKDKDSEILDGYKHGADYYITKPYTSKQIKYGIELYLSK